MAGAATLLQLFDKAPEHRTFRKLAALDCMIDARQFLHHDPAGADVEVPDFRIAHLAGRQADVVAGGVEQRMRARGGDAVEGWCLGLEDGIVSLLLAPAPAVQDDQHDGAMCRHSGLSLIGMGLTSCAGPVSLRTNWHVWDMNAKPEILVLDAAAARAAIAELCEILVDCLEGGASVSFMLPFSHEDAANFFDKAIASVARGETVLVAAKLDSRIVGTVQLGLDMPPNQPHRGDIKKLLVHRAARNRGIGAMLMARAEAEARARGRTLLVLDTASGEAERLYVRSGWQRVGVVPDYAMWPGG